jgi:hypothetical protein
MALNDPKKDKIHDIFVFNLLYTKNKSKEKNRAHPTSTKLLGNGLSELLWSQREQPAKEKIHHQVFPCLMP